MKSAEAILDELELMVANYHTRTSMYVGSKCGPCAADTLDALFHTTIGLWASIQDRESEFQDVVSLVRERHRCGVLPIIQTFHERNRNACPEDVCEFVFGFWRDVADELNVPTA